MISPAPTASQAFLSVLIGLEIPILESAYVTMAYAAKEASVSLSGNSTMVAIALSIVHRHASILQTALASHLKSMPDYVAASFPTVLIDDGLQPTFLSFLHLRAPRNAAVGWAEFSDSVSLADGTGVVANILLQSLKNCAAHKLLLALPESQESFLSTLCETLPSVENFEGFAADNTIEGKWSIYTSASSFTRGISMLGITSSVTFGAELVPPYTLGEIPAKITSFSGRTINAADDNPAAEAIRKWIGSSVEENVENVG